MSEWRPFATAPKDGTRVLLYRPRQRWLQPRQQFREVVVGYWSARANTWRVEQVRGAVALGGETHWMPLPLPPVDACESGMEGRKPERAPDLAAEDSHSVTPQNQPNPAPSRGKGR